MALPPFSNQAASSPRALHAVAGSGVGSLERYQPNPAFGLSAQPEPAGFRRSDRLDQSVPSARLARPSDSAEFRTSTGPPHRHERPAQDNLRDRRHRAWSARTSSKRPANAAHKVRALVRSSSDTNWLDTQGVEKVVGDLAEANALKTGVDGADWVINCAAKVGDWGTLEEFRKLNVDALKLLLDAASEAKTSKFVHVSSLGVYEARDHFGTDESTPPAADSLDAYTRSKTEARGARPVVLQGQGLASRDRPAPASSTASATARSCRSS